MHTYQRMRKSLYIDGSGVYLWMWDNSSVFVISSPQSYCSDWAYSLADELKIYIRDSSLRKKVRFWSKKSLLKYNLSISFVKVMKSHQEFSVKLQASSRVPSGSRDKWKRITFDFRGFIDLELIHVGKIISEEWTQRLQRRSFCIP